MRSSRVGGARSSARPATPLRSATRISELSVLVFSAAIVIVVSLNGGTYATVARSASGAIAWAVFLILTLLGKWPRRWPAREAWRVGGALLALTALAGSSLLWTESVEQSYLEATKLLLFLGVFALAVVCTEHLGSRRPIVDGMSIGFAIVVLLAVLSRLLPSLFPAQELQQLTPETAPRLSYPFNYWNAVGLFAAMTTPLLLYQAAREDGGRAVRALAGAMLPATGLTLYLTFSRGSLLATALAAATLLALTPHRAATLRAGVVGALGAGGLAALVTRYHELDNGLLASPTMRSQGHRVLVALVVVTVLAWLVNLYEPERHKALRGLTQLSSRTTRAAIAGLLVCVVAGAGVGVVTQWNDFRGGKTERVASANLGTRYANASGNGRFQYWDAALHAWRTQPIVGRGAGTWQFWWRRHATLDAPVRDAHSMIFDELSELGALGLLATLAIFGAIMQAGVRRRRERLDQPLVAALLGVIVAFTLSAAIDWTWEVPALGIVFFAAAGVLAAGTRSGAVAPLDMRESDSRFAAGLSAALLAWGAMFALLIPLFATLKISESRERVGRGDLAGAQRSAKTAQSIEPWSASARLQLAQVLEASGAFGPALQKAKDAVDRERTNWENWYVVARIRSELHDDDASARALATARRLNPRSPIWQSLDFGPNAAAPPAIADPDFVPDDEGAAVIGGRVTRRDVLEGSQARVIAANEALEIPRLQGLVIGDRYAISFSVKPRTARATVGRVGDTAGSGWGTRPWAASSRSWQHFRLVLTATATQERLAFREDRGGTIAIDGIAIRRLGRGRS